VNQKFRIFWYQGDTITPTWAIFNSILPEPHFITAPRTSTTVYYYYCYSFTYFDRMEDWVWASWPEPPVQSCTGERIQLHQSCSRLNHNQPLNQPSYLDLLTTKTSTQLIPLSDHWQNSAKQGAGAECWASWCFTAWGMKVHRQAEWRATVQHVIVNYNKTKETCDCKLKRINAGYTG